MVRLAHSKQLGQFFVTGAYRYQHSLSGWDSGKGPYVVPQGTPAEQLRLMITFASPTLSAVKKTSRPGKLASATCSIAARQFTARTLKCSMVATRPFAKRTSSIVTVPTQIFGGN